MYKKSILILLFIIIIQSFAHGADLSGEYILKNYQSYISSVYTCGSWSYQKQSGFYRVIQYDFLFGCSWLYVQWMKGFEKYGTTEELYTLSIYTNDHHENIFDAPNYKVTNDGIKLYYEELNSHSGIKQYVEIDIFNEFGKYTIKRINHL